MTNEKLISVVIPCYNHEKYIEQTVLSVLQQTYTNIELLVADDCSTDASVEVLKSIQDPRLKVFPFEKNHGTVLTLNFLLEQARGEYIATLGSDDAFMPDKLEKQVRVMEANPQLGAVFSWAEIVDGNNNPYQESGSLSEKIFQEENRSRGEWIQYMFSDANHFCHSSAMVRRSVQDEIGLYRPAYRQLHDFEYWLRIICKYPVYVIPEKLTLYRRVDDQSSVSAGKSVKNTTRLYNEFNLIFCDLFCQMDAQLFAQAFGSTQGETGKDGSLILLKEKYLKLRALSLGGCRILGAAQLFFVKYFNESVLSDFDERDQAELLKLYYEDTAQVSVEYPFYKQEHRGFLYRILRSLWRSVKCLIGR